MMFFAISLYAGLVMNIPIATPAIVVIANPTNFPNPNPNIINGIIVAKTVEAEAIIMKNAFLILEINEPDSFCFPFNNSSVITI